MDLFPSRLCQPVAGQQRSHLSLQHAENNLGCVCTCGCVYVCVVAGGHISFFFFYNLQFINRTMQDPDAGGPQLAITELGKLMLCARKTLMWFSSTVNGLGNENGSLELGGEMGTGLVKWAEAMRIRDEVKEGERDYFRYTPEDMDWDAVGWGILRYGRWREIFLGIEVSWCQVGPYAIDKSPI